MVLGICWLPDKVTLILNLTHLLNLDAELCYSWRLICNILIMLNGSLNPAGVSSLRTIAGIEYGPMGKVYH